MESPKKDFEAERFDGAWYLNAYPDVAITGLDPLTHYRQYGAPMGRAFRLLPKPRPVRPDAAPKADPETLPPNCYPDHVQISRTRMKGQALDATALRTGSYEMRKIFACQAMGQTGSLDQLLSILEACRDAVRERAGRKRFAECDQRWLLRLARIMALQALEPEDRLNAFTIYRQAEEIGHIGALNDVNLKIYFDLCLEFGHLDRARALIDQGRFSPKAKPYALADLLNPALGFARDEADWLQHFNAIFRASGHEPVTILPPADDLPPFDRLHAETEVRIEDGPLVSIVVSVWEPDQGLFTAVRSLLAQSWRNIEILLVDDCCASEYLPLIERVAALDPRIRYLRQDRNRGTYMARNLALRHARGAFMTFHDADDWCHPRRIERQIAPLLADGTLMATTSWTVRVRENLVFSYPGYMIPARLNTSSLMFRLKPVHERIGYFHAARKGADSEYLTRITLGFGTECYREISEVLSIVRLGSGSLSRAEFRAGWHHPSRASYRHAYQHWHKKILNGESSPYVEEGGSGGVPVPLRFRVERDPGHRPRYDVVITGDWRGDGGPQNSMYEEIAALRAKGLSVAICHMEALRFMTTSALPLNPTIQEMINSGQVDEITLTDPIDAHLAIFRYPPIFQFPPALQAEWRLGGAILVANQAPHERDGTDMRYEVHDCIRNARRMLGRDLLWMPQGPLVRDMIAPLLPRDLLAAEDSPGIIEVDKWYVPAAPDFGRKPRIGRYSRDNDLKFPADAETLLQCYPETDAFDVVIMGGTKSCAKLLGETVPRNWTLIEHKGMPTRDFLESIDFFVYFDHPEILEAFGRSMLEAVSSGRVTILPYKFERVFGPAAVYCHEDEVEETVLNLWRNPAAYMDQSRRALAHVRDRFSHEGFLRRLAALFPQGPFS